MKTQVLEESCTNRGHNNITKQGCSPLPHRPWTLCVHWSHQRLEMEQGTSRMLCPELGSTWRALNPPARRRETAGPIPHPRAGGGEKGLPKWTVLPKMDGRRATPSRAGAAQGAMPSHPPQVHTKEGSRPSGKGTATFGGRHHRSQHGAVAASRVPPRPGGLQGTAPRDASGDAHGGDSGAPSHPHAAGRGGAG